MIGDNIRKALENKGITSNELAGKIGVSVPYISYLLNNKRNASIETLEKIAVVLNVNVSDFFEDESKEANILFEKVTNDLNKLYELYRNNPTTNLKILISGTEDVSNSIKNLVNSYNKITFISNSSEEIKKSIIGNKEKLESIKNHYEDFRQETFELINDSDKGNKINPIIIPKEFIKANEAREYISMHQIFASEGFNLNKMSDEDILDFANEMLKQVELIGYKYKK